MTTVSPKNTTVIDISTTQDTTTQADSSTSYPDMSTEVDITTHHDLTSITDEISTIQMTTVSLHDSTVIDTSTNEDTHLSMEVEVTTVQATCKKHTL